MYSLILSSDSAFGSMVQARADAPAWVTVDDADPSIQYSSGWQANTDVGGLLDGTRHGATTAGMTVSFRFTGTQVMVAGSMGSWDVQGVPTSQYDIDSRTVGTFTAPIIEPGFRISNQTYFTSDDLPPGEHQLTITNVNGTKPNVFWLDYIAYLPAITPSSTPTPSESASLSRSSSTALSTPSSSSASSTPSSASSTTISSAPSASSTTPISSDPSTPSNSFSSTLSASSTSSAPSSFASGGQQSDTTSAKPSYTAVIVGGAIGGAALLAAILVLIYCKLRRQRRATGASLSYNGDEDTHRWKHGGGGNVLMSPRSNMASTNPLPGTAKATTGAFGVMQDGGHSGIVWAPSPYMLPTPMPTAAPAFLPASVHEKSVRNPGQSVRDDALSPTSANMASSVSSGPSALASTRSGPESTAATSKVASTAPSANSSVIPSASESRRVPKTVEARMTHEETELAHAQDPALEEGSSRQHRHEDHPGDLAVDSGVRTPGEEVSPPPYTRD
ncbi:hypothetical protein C8Q74DRAFT_291487 [Fomes fomentarius]|nr:hypothetical protein C8Q74DRAFT_291487 [Fomes fomentarius]